MAFYNIGEAIHNFISMMYRIIAVFLLSAFSSVSNHIKCQTLVAKYILSQHKTSGLEVDTFLLTSNNDQSIYISHNNISGTQLGMQESYDEEGTTTYTFSEPIGDSIHLQYFIDRDHNKIISREKYSLANGSYQYYIIEEILPQINWSIIPEFKKIGELKCHKAITRFRGRTYEAWFAPSVPSNIGPWKFHGLPGLIVDIREVNNHCRMQCLSYKWLSEKSEINPPSNGLAITLEEFIRMRDRSADAFMMSILSKLPEGAQVSKKSIRNNNLEIEFNF